MKVLVTGVNGQLGHDVRIELERNGIDVVAPSHKEMDIIDKLSVNYCFDTNRPDAAIHCAAWTNVDLAEEEVERCREINVNGTKNIVDCCIKYDIPIIYISTDYVFSGKGEKPWKTTDETDPQNVYGRSKRDGEVLVSAHKKHFIVRISWVFGINGHNFVKTMINVAKTKEELNVVCDQFGSPTYTKDVSVLLREMVVTSNYGTYHACNTGYCNWAEFAKKIFEIAGLKTTVRPIRSDQWQSKVERPKNSRMDTTSLDEGGFKQLPSWEDALRRFIFTELSNN